MCKLCDDTGEILTSVNGGPWLPEPCFECGPLHGPLTLEDLVAIETEAAVDQELWERKMGGRPEEDEDYLYGREV